MSTTAAPSADRFPDGFLWGTATAGHQVEGDNTNSDTWFLEHVQPTVFTEPSGRACNSWELWRDDLDLVAALGANAVRFSVEWARVEPQPGRIDETALDHYEAVVDGALARGLQPVVTLNHFTSPHWFACREGWLAADAADRFAAYCGTVARRFADRIGYAITFNEPNLPRLLSWLHLPPFVRDLERATLDAAASAAGVARYRAANVVLPDDYDAMQEGMLAGHASARAALAAERSDLPVGLSLALIDDVAVGGVPSPVRDRKRAECYEPWLDAARGDAFVGVQNYERAYYDADGEAAPPDSDGVGRNHFGSPVVPGSLAGAVRYAHERAGVPVLVTEHGMSTAEDAPRAAFIEPALRELHAEILRGVPVLGYLHWSLLDNFEWIFGYAPRFGLHEVDRTSFVRTPKPSAAVFATIVRANGFAS